MSTTPLAPSEPYSDVAAGPLRICTLATSLGLMSEARFWVTVPPTLPLTKSGLLELLLIGVPSTTISGWLLPFSVLKPRMWM